MTDRINPKTLKQLKAQLSFPGIKCSPEPFAYDGYFQYIIVDRHKYRCTVQFKIDEVE